MKIKSKTVLSSGAVEAVFYLYTIYIFYYEITYLLCIYSLFFVFQISQTITLSPTKENFDIIKEFMKDSFENRRNEIINKNINVFEKYPQLLAYKGAMVSNIFDTQPYFFNLIK